jgi:hypothetical protein
MAFVVGVVLSASVTAASESQINRIAGNYTYDEYVMTLPTGENVGLGYLGISSSKLIIQEDKSITLIMKLLDGTTVSQTATILEMGSFRNKEYWLAKWPDVVQPVRTEYEIVSEGLTYEIRFTDPSDERLFGKIERATLVRQVP